MQASENKLFSKQPFIIKIHHTRNFLIQKSIYNEKNWIYNYNNYSYCRIYRIDMRKSSGFFGGTIMPGIYLHIRQWGGGGHFAGVDLESVCIGSVIVNVVPVSTWLVT